MTGGAMQPEGLPYVFIIGFNKTATTSLHKLFEASGFPSVHWDGGRLTMTMLSNVCNDQRALSGYDTQYRVFSDLFFRTSRFKFEGNSLFRVLDADYPGALFIYNTRDMQDWLESRVAHTGALNGETLLQFEMRLMRTSDPEQVRLKWRREREGFEGEVRAYFAGNPRFLEIDISDTQLPEKLARFVGAPLLAEHWRRHNPRH